MKSLHFVGRLGIEHFGMMYSLDQITHKILVSGLEGRLNNKLYYFKFKVN